MRSRMHLFTLSKNIDSFIGAIIGFSIILFLAKHSGIGISPDSVTYLSAARNFISGKGLVEFDGVPLVDFPAFYPVFLGIISFITRLDPLIFSPVLNGLLFASLIYSTGSLMNGFYYSSGWYKRIILSCFVLSPCLLEVYSMLWSETIFILLVIFFIVVAKTYFETYSIRPLVILGLIAALACVTRYAGVVLVGTGGMLLILDANSPLPKRIRHLITFTLISFSLLLINLTRNVILSGFPTGARQKGNTPFLQNIYFFGSVLCDWLPIPRNDGMISIITIICMVICIIVFVVLFTNKSTYHSFESIAASFCIVYCGFMILSATFSRYEQFTSRLLAPIYIPLCWGLSYWIPKTANKFSGFKKSGIVALGLLFAATFQNKQLSADYEMYDGVKDAGIPGYTEDPFPQSEIVSFIRQNKQIFKPGYTIYSNAGDAVYFFTGLKARLLPQLVFPRQMNDFYSEPHHYLVWFNDIDNPDVPSLNQILEHKKMMLVRQFNDGSVYAYEDGDK